MGRGCIRKNFTEKTVFLEFILRHISLKLKLSWEVNKNGKQVEDSVREPRVYCRSLQLRS